MAVNVNARVQHLFTFVDSKTSKTLAAFKSAAAKASVNVVPTFNPQGGSFERPGGEATPIASEGDINVREVGATATFAMGLLGIAIAFSML